MSETLNSLGESFVATQKTLVENMENLGGAIAKNKDIVEAEYVKMADNQNTLALKTKEALINYDNTISKLNKEIAEVVSNIKDMVGK